MTTNTLDHLIKLTDGLDELTASTHTELTRFNNSIREIETGFLARRTSYLDTSIWQSLGTSLIGFLFRGASYQPTVFGVNGELSWLSTSSIYYMVSGLKIAWYGTSLVVSVLSSSVFAMLSLLYTFRK
ncbi:hypothetical protein SISSUDRAFT_1040151 [Sistotremastrum suecicum HHB10207 ss-3]|nr:hypothetical protein SISSUDRAFT_1040151 [Sistotremastrum suecicum HHB10207 ss-3]